MAIPCSQISKEISPIWSAIAPDLTRYPPQKGPPDYTIWDPLQDSQAIMTSQMLRYSVFGFIPLPG